jgi:hypothetical protein
MWASTEIKDPVLLHASIRKSIACFGVVSLSTGKFVCLKPLRNYCTILTVLFLPPCQSAAVPRRASLEAGTPCGDDNSFFATLDAVLPTVST